MPANRNALIRYKTIDKCLQNRQRRWTLEDLIDECSDTLYEYEGIDKGVSKRTVQADIQTMRSDKLGYNAPIVVMERKYYTYEDPNYSITNAPISEQDLSRLNEAVGFLKQFQGFSHFRELDGMVQKLEDHVYAKQTKQAPVIDFDKNLNLKGLEFLDPLYQSIIHRKVIEITYRSFKARASSSFMFHPYLLKEYNNRWFALGKKNQQENTHILALDRIEQTIQQPEEAFRYNVDFDAAEYFKPIVGVTLNAGSPIHHVKLFVDNSNAPYVLTKPIHPSQKTVETQEDGVIISLDVKLNFELERVIIGYGESMKVLAPQKLKNRIHYKLKKALENYEK